MPKEIPCACIEGEHFLDVNSFTMHIRELVENSAAKDENLVVADKDGSIKIVPAKELLPLVKDK